MVAPADPDSPAGPSAVAHSPQKRSPGSFAAPQFGQITASGAPQFEQNFRPSRFSVPQRPQSIAPPVRLGIVGRKRSESIDPGDLREIGSP
jgi:hypothetical protein